MTIATVLFILIIIWSFSNKNSELEALEYRVSELEDKLRPYERPAEWDEY